CDDPSDTPSDHALLQGYGADRDGAVTHPVKGGGVDDVAPVVQHALEAGPVDQPQIALAAQAGDGIPFLARRDPTTWERRVVDEHGAGTCGDRVTQPVEVQPPLARRRGQADETR